MVYLNVGYSLERILSNPIFFPIIDGAPSILHSITLFQSRLCSVKNLSIPLKITSPLFVVSNEMQSAVSQ